MMDYLSRYMELMSDTTFAIGAGLFGVGLVIFFGLLAKLAKAGKSSDAPMDPATDLGGGSLTPAASPPAPNLMPPVMRPVPPAAEPPKFTPSPTDTTKIEPRADLAKTVVMSPGELPRPTASPPMDIGMYEVLVRRIASIESEVKKDPLFLDPIMKRIGQLERKIDDLSGLAPKVDELARRPAGAAGGVSEEQWAALSQKVEELSQRPAPTSTVSDEQWAALSQRVEELARLAEQTPAPAPEGWSAGVSHEEFQSFKEKVHGLQKILEHLAESPMNPPS